MIQSLLSTAQSLVFTIIGITGIGFLVVFHEFGHFICAKMFGMRVQSFSIGFGPHLASKKIGGTDFMLSAIPLGGYVDMGSPEGKENDEFSFTARPWYQKFFVIIGGIAFNVLFAYVVFSLLFMAGMPESPALFPENAITVVKNVEKDSVAAKAGLQANDTIVAINGKPTDKKVKNLIDILRPIAGQPATLTVEREGKSQEVAVALGTRNFMGETYGIIPGVGYQLTPLPGLGFFESIKRGFQLTNHHFWNTLTAFKYLLSSGDTSNLVGPVMIFNASIKGAAAGIKIFLIFLSVISISLAVLNLIPLPVLDGGRLLIYTIEAIIGREIPERIKEYIFIATWLALLGLTVFMIGKDIMQLAGNYIEGILKFFGLR
jgi:regulator of sigma E protease